MGPLFNIEWIEIDIASAAGRDYVNRKWIIPQTLKFQRPRTIQILQN